MKKNLNFFYVHLQQMSELLLHLLSGFSLIAACWCVPPMTVHTATRILHSASCAPILPPAPKFVFYQMRLIGKEEGAATVGMRR